MLSIYDCSTVFEQLKTNLPIPVTGFPVVGVISESRASTMDYRLAFVAYEIQTEIWSDNIKDISTSFKESGLAGKQATSMAM